MNKVTILILVETSLQQKNCYRLKENEICHNPYFSGNFFATERTVMGALTSDTSQSLF